MKKFPLAAILAALLLVSVPLSSCTGSSDASDGAETHEIVTIPPVTIPTEPDDRTPTDLSEYIENLDTLFAVAEPAPAEDFTYELIGEGIPGETFQGTVTITGYTGGETVVVIPETIEGAPVTAIGKDAFLDKTTIKGLSIPDSVTSISFGALKGCKNLTSLRTPVFTCEDAPYFGALFGAETYEANGYTVPVGLTMLVLTDGDVIPACAFYACRNLEVVSLPETLTEMQDFAFYGCQSLAYITTATTALTSVGRNAFTNCSELLTLELPASVETLGFAMLEGCASLESLTLPFAGGNRVGYTGDREDREDTTPADTTYLGYIFGASEYTFTAGYMPKSLISITLQAGCGDVPANAFFECTTVREITLPEGVIAIGRRAFYGCTKLASMTLPDSVKSLGDDALHGCVSLAAFTGGSGLTTLGMQAFMDCVSLKTVTLPAGVTNLPNACFAGCISLESLTADGVKTQGKQVFRHCDKLAGSKWVSAAPAESQGS